MTTAVPTRYVVPAKQAVFKHAPHRDLGQCVLSWLERRDGPELARRKEGSAVQLQAARQAALAAAPTGDDSSLRAMLLYYHCLRALDLPFGTDEASGQMHVRFEFTDAFNTGSKSKSYDPVLEAASMLFNAAASLSAQAAQARSQVTPESIKRQCSLYRMASGLFQHLREEVQFELAYRAGSALTADLSVEALRALELIMLAQAQECFFESAQLSQKMSPPTLAKVASGTALCWAQAARAAGLPGLADSLGGATIARPYSLAQQSYYASRAQLLVAQAEVASLDSAMGVGIQRLRALAGPLRASAQQALKVLAGSEKRARSSGAKEAATAAQLAARGTALDQAVDQLLERSERDNESIYMVAVPPGLQPPPVEAKTLVGPLPVDDPASIFAQSLPEADPEVAAQVKAFSRLGRSLEVEGECLRVERDFAAAQLASDPSYRELQIFYVEKSVSEGVPPAKGDDGAAAAAAVEPVWEFDTGDGDWRPFERTTAASLEAARASGETQATFSFGRWTYTVNVHSEDGKMHQTNTTTGKQRPVRRVGLEGEAAAVSTAGDGASAPGQGPVSAGRLAVLLLRGRLGAGTSVWAEGIGPRGDPLSWRAVSSLLGVKPGWFSDSDDATIDQRESRPPVAFAKVLEERIRLQADGAAMRAARERQRAVTLNVYHVSLSSFISGLNKILPKAVVGGAYHAGIEVDGVEWSYGWNEDGTTGVFECAPMMNDAHRFAEAVSLGATPMSPEQVARMLSALEAQWVGKDYNLTTHNCCDYCAEMAQRLGCDPPPQWLNKLARAGARLGL